MIANCYTSMDFCAEGSFRWMNVYSNLITLCAYLLREQHSEHLMVKVNIYIHAVFPHFSQYILQFTLG